jgi:hypothetical protein
MEDEFLLQTYREVGSMRFVIGGLPPGRGKNSVKNRYFALGSKRGQIRVSVCPYADSGAVGKCTKGKDRGVAGTDLLARLTSRGWTVCLGE